MNRITKLLAGVALVAGLTVGTSGIASASDAPAELRPCEEGVGTEGQVGPVPFRVCVYPWP